MQKYFKEIENKVKVAYAIADEAKAKGFDPVSKVEIPLASNLAEKALGLISTIYPQLNDKAIVNRILELEKQYGALDSAVSFKIAEEIAKERFCKFENLMQAIDAGIRVGFAYITLGVVSSPIEGFTELKLGKTNKGEDYFIAYFSGPIRSAGTTASCMVLMLIDYLRETFGYAKFDPDEKEVKRYITENYDYHERVTNLQYLPTEEEIEFLAKNLPIQIAGDPSEDKEVSNYKDLPRVDTNNIRGGMCLIFSEGLAQKAQKGFRLLNGLKSKGFKTSGWDFLEEYIKLHKKREKGSADSSPTYIKDLVAGRPVFSHPSRSGGFRFRYGRSRTGGFSATSVHPATMAVSNCFLSNGTQLKVEKPTKGCAITVCDSIDGPIVKLKDGSVRRLENFLEAKKLVPEIKEIIYLGDLLFSLGDVINRNYELIRSPYVDEWWELELRKAGTREETSGIDRRTVPLQRALELSDKFNIPLHPNHIFFWSQIDKEGFMNFLKWFLSAELGEKIILSYDEKAREEFSKGKRALELLGVEHSLLDGKVIISGDSNALLINLGLNSDPNYKSKIENALSVFSLLSDSDFKVLDEINKLSKYRIKDKAGVFIGARMGRPEKAKLRKLIGSPHVLFPVGEEGGRLRSFQEAMENGKIEGDFPIYHCEKCKKETIYYVCETCNEKTQRLMYCPDCDRLIQEVCPVHGGLAAGKIRPYMKKRLDIKAYMDQSLKQLRLEKSDMPALIKGVRGTSSAEHSIEHLSKGILRAKFGLHVNKDGTIRYDATELPITHFKPFEINVSITKLKDLGYNSDIYGRDLENPDQILELKPHDIILPSCPDSDDEKADVVFMNIAKFIDSLLVRFYGLKPFYELKSREDLVGQLTVCMAPHNCAGVITRILGFSKVQGIIASPYVHAAVRRDCDGDEVAVMLLLDVLINFSRKFLPAHRGGTQDAPLVLNSKINAGEVDDQILDFELGPYPLELYELSEKGEHSSKIFIDNVRNRLKAGVDPFTNVCFTHPCSDINSGVVNSSYKSLPTMEEKVQNQMDLAEKIRAVDTSDVARLVIERHFIRDIRGNLRKFSTQQFRCVGCNAKFRRPPLVGKCTSCGGRIIFTISEGSILKYLEPALQLAHKYNVSDYIKQNLELTQKYIESIFGKEIEKQQKMSKWF